MPVQYNDDIVNPNKLEKNEGNGGNGYIVFIASIEA